MNAIIIRQSAAKRGYDRACVDHANSAPLPQELTVSRPLARSMVRSTHPGWFWSLRLPFLFLVWTYLPDMQESYESGYLEGRRRMAAASERSRILRWRLVRRPAAPNLWTRA